MDIARASVFLNLLNGLFVRPYLFNQRFNNVMQNSLTYTSFLAVWRGMSACFKYSFFGRITEINEVQTKSAVLVNSRFLQYFINFFKDWQQRAIRNLGASCLVKALAGMGRRLYSFPVKTASDIVLIGVLTNITLSFIFRLQINPWGWFIRAVLFLISFAGLFCKADFPTIKTGRKLLK